MHPTLEELIEFVQGRMDPSSQAEVESHVEDCNACCELLRTAPNDTLLEQLVATKRRPALAPAPAETPPVRCQTAADLLAEIKKSAILTPEEWELALAAAAQAQVGEARPSAIRLAEVLVAEKLITPWQSDRLLAREGKSLVLDKYQLLSLLGSGGMAKVYLARQARLNRQVAIKLLPKAKIINGSYLERFHREAQLVAALDHKNIVRAYHADNVGQQHFLVMEYIVGPTLEALVERDGPLACELAADYVAQAAEGLAHAAQAGIIHRDIKPANLLLDAEGTIKILDMGLGRLSEATDHSITQKYDDRLIGTTDYMAPEQALDAHAADARADIYSLGGTLYFLLTGQAPFPEGTVAERLLKHQREEPEPIRALRPDCPTGLAAICQRMMAKRPADRYQTPDETAAALRKWLKNPQWIEIQPERTPAGAAARDQRSRQPRRLIAAGLIGGLLLAIAGVMAVRNAGYWTPPVQPEPAPAVVTPPVVAQPAPEVVAAKALLAQHDLQLDALGRYILKAEAQARTLLAQLEKGEADVARCQAELAAFQKTYRETIVRAEQERRNAGPAKQGEPARPQTELQKSVWLLPQHHHTHEMALHQARVGLIEGIQKGLTLASTLENAHRALHANPRIAAAVATLAAHGQPKAALSPSDEVERLAAQLNAWSERLVREELPLNRQGTALAAEITVGEVKLLVDIYPAAISNQISDEQARRLGISISAAAPRVSLYIGRDDKGAIKNVLAPEVVLDRVVLGPLTNTFVRVAVIPPEHPTLRPALSAAFLYGRKCEVDAKAGLLKILRLRESAAP